ncbi:MAG: hypothetical protein AAF432_12445, partial [Planctomycetota bacterium]
MLYARPSAETKGPTMRGVLAVILACALSPSGWATTWFVDAEADDGGNGLSWATAATNLDQVLPLTEAGDDIWVARGTYRPPIEMNDTGFIVERGVRILGGFTDDDDVVSDRDPSVNLTWIEGATNSGTADDPIERGRGFTIVAPVDEPVTIDGFNIVLCGIIVEDDDAAGGAIHAPDASHVTVIDCEFQSNLARTTSTKTTSEARGGAIASTGGTLIIDRCTFFFSTTQQISAFANQDVGGTGSAIATIGTDVQILESQFTENGTSGTGLAIPASTLGSGGAVATHDGILEIIDSSFVKNRAIDGGAVHATNTSPLVIEMTDFFDNAASSLGGAINSGNSPLVVRDSLFGSNDADAHGGAICGSIQDISSTLFSGNAATFRGGAIATTEGATIRSCDFIGNAAYLGGGVSADVPVTGDPVLLESSRFASNFSFPYDPPIGSENFLGGGGGLYLRASSFRVTRCQFERNTGSIGGGAWMTTLSPPNGGGIQILDNCLFDQNTALTGGALVLPIAQVTHLTV